MRENGPVEESATSGAASEPGDHGNIAGNGARPAIREQERSDTDNGKQIKVRESRPNCFLEASRLAAVVLAVSSATTGP